MASLTTDTSLTQQATALAKEFGLQLMTPASVTVEELEQLLIDQLKKVKALRESNQSTGETKEEVVLIIMFYGVLFFTVMVWGSTQTK